MESQRRQTINRARMALRFEDRGENANEELAEEVHTVVFRDLEVQLEDFFDDLYPVVVS